MNIPIRKLALTFVAGLLFASANAQVSVSNAWVVATVSVQKSSAAFMQFKSEQPLTLVGVSSAVAGLAEVHDMNMVGGVMQMRPVRHLALAAGQLVEFKQGGTHLMLMDLKQQLKPGQSIPITFTFETDGKSGPKKKIEQQLTVPVRTLTDPMATAEHAHKH